MVGCYRQLLAREMCGMHWQRWRNSARAADVRPYGQQGCLVEGCLGTHDARGYCQKHYRRLMRLDVGGDQL